MSEKIYGQFDLETIEKLADIVKNKDLGEITIADGDKVITVRVRNALLLHQWECLCQWL